MFETEDLITVHNCQENFCIMDIYNIIFNVEFVSIFYGCSEILKIHIPITQKTKE